MTKNPECRDCIFWQKKTDSMGTCRHTPPHAQVMPLQQAPFQTVWASTDGRMDFCWQGVDRTTGKPFLEMKRESLT